MYVKGMEIDGVMKVSNVCVYGLTESIIASGYPMQTETDDMMAVQTPIIKDINRAKGLGNAKPGSGHDCYLKGVTVQFDLQVPEYIWRQLDRYHFIDYVSSQSKMHKIVEHDISSMCNKYVDDVVITNLEEWIEIFNDYDNHEPGWFEDSKEDIWNRIIANTPCGLMLTARMTTNYLQLKSIYAQRKTHKMQEWRYLTEWFKTLPMFEDLALKVK